MPSPKTNAATQREWRALGFFCDLGEDDRTWRIVGSASGLATFAARLRACAGDPRNAAPGEHEHFGPCGYFEVMTSTAPGIDAHAISGRLEDLARRADLVEHRGASMRPGDRVRIGHEYAPDAAYGIELEFAPEGFEPAAADPALPPSD